MPLKKLHDEAKHLGFQVSWAKTKVQVFGDLLDETVQSLHACGEDIEILEIFTYFGCVVHNDGAGRARKLQGGLAKPTELWTRSTQVFGVIGTCANRRRFGSSCR